MTKSRKHWHCHCWLTDWVAHCTLHWQEKVLGDVIASKNLLVTKSCIRSSVKMVTNDQVAQTLTGGLNTKQVPVSRRVLMVNHQKSRRSMTPEREEGENVNQNLFGQQSQYRGQHLLLPSCHCSQTGFNSGCFCFSHVVVCSELTQLIRQLFSSMYKDDLCVCVHSQQRFSQTGVSYSNATNLHFFTQPNMWYNTALLNVTMRSLLQLLKVRHLKF